MRGRKARAPPNWLLGTVRQHPCQDRVSHDSAALSEERASVRLVEWCGVWRSAADGFDDVSRDGAKFAILILGRLPQDGKGAVAVATLLSHHDSECLVDDGSCGECFAELIREFRLLRLTNCDGKHHGRLDAEDFCRLPLLLTERGLGRRIEVECTSDVAVYAQRERQRTANAISQGARSV